MGILPGEINFEGISGTTFDGNITVLPSAAFSLKWENDPVWISTANYVANSGVLASNGKAYKSLQASVDKNPLTETAYWEVITPQNITGYKAEVKIGNNFELILKNGEGITISGSEGLVAFKATKVQTEIFDKSNVRFALFMEDTEANYYQYVTGKVVWKLP
jgi:hypothetical protein